MKSYFLLYCLLIQGLIFHCFVPSVMGQDSLDNPACIKQENKQELQTMFRYFNDYLVQRYDLEEAPTEATYQQFAKETADLKIAPEDFVTENFPAIIKKCKVLSLYESLYRKDARHNQSEIYNCLLDSLSNEDLKLGLQHLKNAPPEFNLSPTVIAGGYFEAGDFQSESTQLLLSLDVFYPILNAFLIYQERHPMNTGN